MAFFAACTSTPSSNSSVDLKRAAELNAEMGARYLAQGDIELAKKKLEKALAQNSNLAAAHAGYALMWNALGDSKQASKHFKRAIKLDRYDPATLNNYGTFLCSQGKPKEAEKHFLEALKDPLYKTPEYAYTNAGRCSLKDNDYDKAEAYFGKALTVNPRFPDALVQLSKVYAYRRNYKLADAYLTRFEEHGVHTPESLWLGIRIAQKNNDKNKVASYSLLLKNKFPKSNQASLLRQLDKQ